MLLSTRVDSDNPSRRRPSTYVYLFIALVCSFLLARWIRDSSFLNFIPSGNANSTYQDQPSPAAEKVPQPPTTSDPPRDTLILYAYHETENARQNAEFFIKHGLHDSADFIFIFIGNHTNLQTTIPSQSNVRVVRHENHCYDIGSYGTALAEMGDELKRYKRFILLNASIRGPFVPHWSKECWSDAYLGRVTEDVKLVGMSYNCGPFARHLQSMILATDTTGLAILLNPASQTLTTCPEDHATAVEAEIRITAKIREAGYKVDAMMEEFQAEADFVDTCTGEDRNWDGAYDHGIKGADMNLHPYEMLFFKANRQISQKLFERLTEWTDKNGYSSYGVCRDSARLRFMV